MTKDEALDLALEALGEIEWSNNSQWQSDRAKVAITAIKQARALDKMAENARELGLDYEPVTTLFGSLPVYDTPPVQEDWGPGPHECHSLTAAPVQEPFGYFRYDMRLDAWVQSRDSNRGIAFYTTPPAAQRQWVGLTNDEINEFAAGCHLGNSVQGAIFKAQAKLKEKNT